MPLSRLVGESCSTQQTTLGWTDSVITAVLYQINVFYQHAGVFSFNFLKQSSSVCHCSVLSLVFFIWGEAAAVCTVQCSDVTEKCGLLLTL